MDNLLEWLFSESGIAWIVAIFSAFGWFINWKKHEKPTTIVIQEVENVDLLDIHPSQKDNLIIQYKDDESIDPIHNLVQKKAILYNTGSKDIIEPLEFSVFYSPMDSANNSHKPGFIKVISDRPECAVRISRDSKDDNGEIIFTLAYLNSMQNHDHFIILHILTEQPIHLEHNPIVGKGWSVRIYNKERLSKIKPYSKAFYNIFIFTVLWLALNIIFSGMNRPLAKVMIWPEVRGCRSPQSD